MLPTVGMIVHFIRPGVPGARPLAGIVCYVEGPEMVNVVYWDEDGTPLVRPTTRFVAPGSTPPTHDHCVPPPVPGAPTVSPGIK